MAKKMSAEEKEQWNELYSYVHDVIMGYDEKTALDRYFVLRLKGLKEGKFIANNKTKLYGEYTFQEILATFMYCKSEIVKGLTFNDFKTELNYKPDGITKEVELKGTDVVNTVEYGYARAIKVSTSTDNGLITLNKKVNSTFN